MHLIKSGLMLHVVDLYHVGILNKGQMSLSNSFHFMERQINVYLRRNRHVLLGRGSGRIE